MASSTFRSPNFGFLAKHDEVLVKYAALAERYVFDDANSALVKLRQFAELLAEHCAAYTGIAVDERDSFLNVLDNHHAFREFLEQVDASTLSAKPSYLSTDDWWRSYFGDTARSRQRQFFAG